MIAALLCILLVAVFALHIATDMLSIELKYLRETERIHHEWLRAELQREIARLEFEAPAKGGWKVNRTSDSE